MKKTIIISMIAIIILISLFLIIKPGFTGYSVYNNDVAEKVKLGYCSTMQKEAISLSEEKNYGLVKLGSASEVLDALKNNQIDKALIGRKAKSGEIDENTKETVLSKGYTLVSNKKRFVDYSKLYLIEVYTYLSDEIVKELVPGSKINLIKKNEIIYKINEGKVVLIPWKDWNDDFELVVVMNGNQKVKDFRGVFLYEN